MPLLHAFPVELGTNTWARSCGICVVAACCVSVCVLSVTIGLVGMCGMFLQNLDKDIDNKALHDTFSAFGNILSCKVVLDPLGASKGYGFVHYENGEAASMAIEKVCLQLRVSRSTLTHRWFCMRLHILLSQGNKMLASIRSYTPGCCLQSTDAFWLAQIAKLWVVYR